jgi:hypothetical protein
MRCDARGMMRCAAAAAVARAAPRVVAAWRARAARGHEGPLLASWPPQQRVNPPPCPHLLVEAKRGDLSVPLRLDRHFLKPTTHSVEK